MQESRRNAVLFRVAAAVGAVVILLAGWLFYHSLRYVSTDDAVLTGPIVDISPKISGQVGRVLVVDNQEVQQEQLLVQIDPRDYEERLSAARAQLASAETAEKVARINVDLTAATAHAGVLQESSGVEAARATANAAVSLLAAAQAELRARQADAALAQADLARDESLYARDEVSKQQLDRAAADAKRASAQAEAARRQAEAAAQNLKQAHSQIGEAQGRFGKVNVVAEQMNASRAELEGAKAAVRQAAAAVQMASLNLSYTKITAPSAGRITKKSVEAGNYVQAGESLFSIVPHEVWVVANFKETQLTHMRPGEPAEIRVDAYRHHVFTGHVESIQAGTGSVFSLLPPENASGNFVKVVQRIPVKIVLDGPIDPQYALSPGMSVTPQVKIR